jgi:hypothetical protein
MNQLLHKSSFIPFNRFSTAGRWGFIVGLLFIFSISAEYRLSVFGLLVHPYLILMPFAILFGQINFNNLPGNVRNSLFLFFFIFSLACIQNINPLSEIFKVGASLLTFIFFALSIKSEKDFRYISWAFVLCALVIGIQGFLLGDEVSRGGRLSGINALEGLGNKNAQSLFTLPGIFLGGLLLLKYLKEKNSLGSLLMLISIFFILVSVLLSANRSGWLGLIIIVFVFVFYLGLGTRSLMLLGIFSVFTYFAIDRYASDIVEHKSEQTIEGYSSDEGRQRLALLALDVGIENPLLGVGMDELHKQMAIRLKLNKFGVEKTDTHFLIGYLFGATGIFSLVAFIFFLFSIVKKRYPRIISNRYANQVRKARLLLVGFVILFGVRSLFSREILYSPTFMGGIGLLFGYYLFLVRSSNDQNTSK